MDEQDFRRFVASAVPSLLPVAGALTGSQHAAEELLTTALARVAGRWHHVDGSHTAHARRVLFREYAGRRGATAGRELLSLDAADQTGDRVRHGAFQQLEPRPRALLVLRYLQECADAETAEVIGTSAGTVDGEIIQALGRLRSLRTALDPGAAGDIEDEVRRTVRELAGAVAPADLAPAALAAARRARRTRLGVAAAAVVVVLAVAGGVGVTALRPEPPPPDLDGLSVVTSYREGFEAWYVLDPDTGEYRFRVDEVGAVSPDLRRFIAEGGDEVVTIASTTDHDNEITIQVPETVSAARRWSAWSPDGTRIAAIAATGFFQDPPDPSYRRVSIRLIWTRVRWTGWTSPASCRCRSAGPRSPSSPSPRPPACRRPPPTAPSRRDPGSRHRRSSRS